MGLAEPDKIHFVNRIAVRKANIVTHYAKMWPRGVFDLRKGRKLHGEVQELLKRSGVYILYRDDQPYYIGKTAGSLFDRIYDHANKPADPYYNFWNFFSVFVVPKIRDIREVESILIAATPTSNKARPKITRLKLPRKVAACLRRRTIPVDGNT